MASATPRAAEAAGNMSSTVTVITSACKDPVAAVRFIDYMYSPEGSDLLTWGIEGETYRIVDGKKELTEKALTVDEEKRLADAVHLRHRAHRLPEV